MNLKEAIEYIIKFFEWWIVILPWEQGIRIFLGKKIQILNPGIYWKIPLIHSVFVKTDRLRVVAMPIQTITTKDGKTISIACAVGFSIIDLKLLYETLHEPDATICNIILGEISKYVAENNLIDCTPLKIEKVSLSCLQNSNYGIKYEYVNVVGYAIVRTYRLIQDTHWTPTSIDMSNKE